MPPDPRGRSRQPDELEQIDTILVSLASIMRSPDFADGLDDIRAGKPFDSSRDSWSYERGRQFGAIAPLSMPLFVDGRLNRKALELFRLAYQRGLVR
jgi:hypothetical protein